MLVARILPRAGKRLVDDEPITDVLLALSASTAAMIAVLDLVAGRWPITSLGCGAIVASRALWLRRTAIVAAAVIWLRITALSDPNGLAVPLVMLGICAVLLIGPGRVFDWLEARWGARVERLEQERELRIMAWAEAEGIEAIGWIEDLPDR